jgi:hypothetical protein
MPKQYDDHIHYPDLFKMPLAELLTLRRNARQNSKCKRTDREKAIIRVANRRDHWSDRAEGAAPPNPNDNKKAAKANTDSRAEEWAADRRGVKQGRELVQQILAKQRSFAQGGLDDDD